METENKSKPVDLLTLQSQSQDNLPDVVAVYAILKIKVKRIPELDSNFVGFRAYWQEELRRVLKVVGDVKVVNVIT
jgi:hypothetical protein